MADKFSFLKKVYGEQGVHIVNREKMNSDEEFEKVLNNLFIELGEKSGYIYYDTAKFLFEDDPQAEISTYLKENADDIAKHIVAMSLRFLRHPHATKEYRPFLKYCYYLNSDEDWYALEDKLVGRRLDSDEECKSFAQQLKDAFDNMSGEKIDAVLAVRYGSDVVDKNDPAVIETYKATIEELKQSIKV